MNHEIMRCAFQALSDPTRIKIIKFLSHAYFEHSEAKAFGESHRGSTEDEICGYLAGPSSRFISITHHLHELEAVGLITIGRRDNMITCVLRPFMFKALSAELNAIAKGIDLSSD